MTATATENPPETLAADSWYDADEPDETSEPAGQDGGEAAPWGYTTDPETGQRRPKKAPGRPRKPPGPEELAAGPPLQREPDRPPEPRKRKIRTPPPGDEMPMPKGGVIAAGVNKLYRRAGKIIRGLEKDDYGIGQAFIECTRTDQDVPEEERELTVGEAWENLARTNPRIRAFLVKTIAGGAWGDLVMAHAPIGVALFMKPWVQRLIPFGRLVESVAEPDEDTPEGEGGLPGGMTAADVAEMGGVVSAQARRMAEKAARAAGMQVSEEDMAAAAAAAEKMMADGGLPAGFRRQQPKRTTRAQRTGAR